MTKFIRVEQRPPVWEAFQWRGPDSPFPVIKGAHLVSRPHGAVTCYYIAEDSSQVERPFLPGWWVVLCDGELGIVGCDEKVRQHFILPDHPEEELRCPVIVKGSRCMWELGHAHGCAFEAGHYLTRPILQKGETFAEFQARMSKDGSTVTFELKTPDCNPPAPDWVYWPDETELRV